MAHNHKLECYTIDGSLTCRQTAIVYGFCKNCEKSKRLNNNKRLIEHKEGGKRCDGSFSWPDLTAVIDLQKNLSSVQEKALLEKHLTGEFPGGKWSTIEALIAAGMVETKGKDLALTAKGRAYCDAIHSRI